MVGRAIKASAWGLHKEMGSRQRTVEKYSAASQGLHVRSDVGVAATVEKERERRVNVHRLQLRVGEGRTCGVRGPREFHYHSRADTA